MIFPMGWADDTSRVLQARAPTKGRGSQVQVTGCLWGSPRLRSGQALRLRFARELDLTDRPDAALIFAGDGTIDRHLGGLALKPTGSIFARVRSRSPCGGLPSRIVGA